MKTLILKICFALFFCLIFSSAISQVKKSKAKKTVKAATDTVARRQLDSLIKNGRAKDAKIDSLEKHTVATSAKADAASVIAKAASVKAAKTQSPDSSGIGQYIGKTYTFNQKFIISECDSIGSKVNNKATVVPGQRFDIKKVLNDGDFVVEFWVWKLDESIPEDTSILNSPANTKKYILSKTHYKDEKKAFEQLDKIAKRESLNFKEFGYKYYAPSTINVNTPNDNIRYFILPKDSLKANCTLYKYVKVKNWDINYGALVTTFKLRFNKFSFSNNLSVGGAVYYQKKIDTVWSWGLIGALSLSSVTLDAASTNLHSATLLTSSTTRPAFSPSIHYAITYKNINLTIGIGLDLLNKPTNAANATATNPEAGWIYNNKPWLGIGLGFNLFTSSSAKATPNDKGQEAP